MCKCAASIHITAMCGAALLLQLVPDGGLEATGVMLLHMLSAYLQTMKLMPAEISVGVGMCGICAVVRQAAAL